MKILGIDPGMAIVGYSIIEYDGCTPVLLHSGSIQTDKNQSDSKRLLEIFNDLSQIVEMYSPDCASVEQLFFFKNQKTIIPVAQARGVILLALQEHNVPIYEYTPLVVKQTITGHGRADKTMVKLMVKNLEILIL